MFLILAFNPRLKFSTRFKPFHFWSGDLQDCEHSELLAESLPGQHSTCPPALVVAITTRNSARSLRTLAGFCDQSRPASSNPCTTQKGVLVNSRLLLQILHQTTLKGSGTKKTPSPFDSE